MPEFVEFEQPKHSDQQDLLGQVLGGRRTGQLVGLHYLGAVGPRHGFHYMAGPLARRSAAEWAAEAETLHCDRSEQIAKVLED